MSHLLLLAVIAAKTVILLLGGAITLVAYRAYRRTGAESLRMLALGFGTVTFGAILGGVVHQVLEVSLEVGLLLDSVLTAIGFGIIVLSLYRKY